MRVRARVSEESWGGGSAGALAEKGARLLAAGPAASRRVSLPAGVLGGVVGDVLAFADVQASLLPALARRAAGARAIRGASAALGGGRHEAQRAQASGRNPTARADASSRPAHTLGQPGQPGQPERLPCGAAARRGGSHQSAWAARTEAGYYALDSVPKRTALAPPHVLAERARHKPRVGSEAQPPRPALRKRGREDEIRPSASTATHSVVPSSRRSRPPSQAPLDKQMLYAALCAHLQLIGSRLAPWACGSCPRTPYPLVGAATARPAQAPQQQQPQPQPLCAAPRRA